MTDVFTVLAADGTEGSVTVTVTGSNDVPVVHAGDDREEAETTTVCGAWTDTLENANPDSDALAGGAEVTDEFTGRSADGAPAEVTTNRYRRQRRADGGRRRRRDRDQGRRGHAERHRQRPDAGGSLTWRWDELGYGVHRTFMRTGSGW